MKTILATAYAINPYKGSEDGTGWNLVGQIARFNKVVVVTRENNQESIEKYLSEYPDSIHKNIKFLYFDLPYWMRFWKKGERGAMLYFYLWQFFMPYFIKKSNVHFDILHNLNFHNDWTPTFLWKLNKPLVWGPIGHHPKAPSEYVYKPYGRIEYLKSRILWVVKNLFWKCDPFLGIALKKADKIICMNSGVEKVHKIPAGKVVRMCAVSSDSNATCVLNDSSMFSILSVGRLVPLKGFDITLKAFHVFFNTLSGEQKKCVQLHLVGKGPLLNFLKNEIKVLGLENAVLITEWVEKEKMKDIYTNASVFLFPSHEGAGMVVPEALSYGLPVICFDNEGPGEFIDSSCGLKVPYSNYSNSVEAFSKQLGLLFQDSNLYRDLSIGALKTFNSTFDWNIKGDILRDVYNSLKN
ncbi:glycosyltransferase [Cytophaga hutchinsonii]|uniref:A-glycosyltransferase-related protein, glycosyltransferase family 4 protein n=1 Tax=Cytophaga hutchinsonii (strain ATCC 33406 / DSM 1761 / CIP 103989 / NBRC 15051 / NCIMB 9469 / D465) TaxID=269798 RepID=A0A6N4SUY4_CYTH3|nr:glycosyltransferase [Cytophaga hutchinsonii]ABG60138.1 a-glycosyltransferase-related protein, glycosyltransferase family 4 protein [Cytophaga hutchinsonii ATCC 33406]SFX23362.1 Glycosyltransferase involved in cell wall bisynthesis [Cytophaga hutchinsonii ATCC 33406]